MRELARERAAKYLEAMSQFLKALKVKNSPTTISSSQLDSVLDLARAYARDAQHYLGEQKPVTALACVAYAEGLLDALKLLQMAEF